MPTAPSTIFSRAAMTAEACCRCSIACAISGGVGQRRDPHLDDLQPGQDDPLGDLRGQLGRDDLGVAAQGDLRGVVVVGVAHRHVPQGRLGLHRHEVLVVLDGEGRPGRVGHLPDDDGRDVDGVAVGVVDLELVGLEVVHPDRDVATGGQRDDHPQPLRADGADVAAEELHDPRLPRSHDRQRGGQQQPEDDDRDAADDEADAATTGVRVDDARDRHPAAQAEEQQRHGEPGEAVDGPRLPLGHVHPRALVPHRVSCRRAALRLADLPLLQCPVPVHAVSPFSQNVMANRYHIPWKPVQLTPPPASAAASPGHPPGRRPPSSPR